MRGENSGKQTSIARGLDKEGLRIFDIVSTYLTKLIVLGFILMFFLTILMQFLIWDNTRNIQKIEKKMDAVEGVHIP